MLLLYTIVDKEGYEEDAQKQFWKKPQEQFQSNTEFQENIQRSDSLLFSLVLA